MQELRVRIDDKAHEYLKTLAKKQGLTLSQVISALIRQTQAPKDEEQTKMDVVLLQLQRVQQMLQAILDGPAPADEAPQEPADPAPLQVASYEAMYGPLVPPAETNGMEQIPEYFRQPP